MTVHCLVNCWMTFDIDEKHKTRFLKWIKENPDATFENIEDWCLFETDEPPSIDVIVDTAHQLLPKENGGHATVEVRSGDEEDFDEFLFINGKPN